MNNLVQNTNTLFLLALLKLHFKNVSRKNVFIQNDKKNNNQKWLKLETKRLRDQIDEDSDIGSSS